MADFAKDSFIQSEIHLTSKLKKNIKRRYFCVTREDKHQEKGIFLNLATQKLLLLDAF